jgi:class 3 adenylate cyclase/tetratricopeptide (TPR) repeat protein
MSPSEQRIAQLEAAIASLQAQRSPQGDAALDPALTLLRSQLAEVRQSRLPAPAARLEGERKLVTIMFADIVGFTALAETLDAETVRDLINGCFQQMVPIIEKYQGTVDKFIGDEIMALFGAPHAAENGPELALRAALDMKDALAVLNAERQVNLELHFGVNTGLVIAGGMGSEGREQYSVMGDAVNLASRLEGASGRSEILVGPETYRLTAALCEYEKLQPIMVKGKGEPVEVYRLLRMKRTPGALRGIVGLRSPLVAREKEVGQVQAALRDLQQGKGGVIAILGEAGLGKSRLIAEVRQSLVHGITWVEARALSYAQRVSYGVIRDLLQGLAGIDENVPPEEASRTLRKSAEALLADQAAEVFPYLARLCELSLDGISAERVKYLAPEALQRQMVRAFQQYLRARAAAEPLALVWEDLHWIDPSSLRLLETLLPLTREVPLLLLLVFRSEPEGQVEGFHRRAKEAYGEHYKVIELGPLSRAESTGLVQNLLQIENLPEQTHRLILDKAEGNPFFLEELLRSLIDAGLVVLREGRAVASENIQQLQMPNTLQGLIAARIDRLAPEPKHTLQAASVIGRIFQQRVLAHLLKREPEQYPLGTALEELERRELVRRRDALQTLSEYIFKHAITQDVAYHSLLVARRKVLHKVVAETIEALFPDSLDELASTVAYHYERAEVCDRAILYLVRAADRARAAYANDEAIAFYRAAIKQVDQLKTEQPGESARQASTLYESLGDTLLSAARYEEARAAYGDALAYVPANHNVHRAHLLRQQGNAWSDQRRVLESLAHYDLAEAALGPESNKDDSRWWKEWLAIQIDRTGAYYFLGRLTDISDLVERTRPVVGRYGTPSQRRDLLDSLLLVDLRRCRFYMLPDETLARARTNVAGSRESGDLSEIAFYQFNLGFVHLWRDELEQAEEELAGSLGLATRIGHVALQTKCCTYLAVTHRKHGEVKKTLEFAQRSLSLATASDNLVYIALARGNLAWVEWRQGSLAQAEKNAHAALELFPAAYIGIRWIIIWPLLGVALVQDQLVEAVGHARTLLEPKETRMPDNITAALDHAIQAWEKSELEIARAHLQRASELARLKGYL